MEVMRIISLLNTSLQRQDILDYLKKIVLEILDGYEVKVYLFGSWAKQKEKRTSDIDVGVWFKNGSDNVLVDLRQAVEDSEIPYKVEIVDLNCVGEYFFKKVEDEGILWKDYTKESREH